MTNKPEPGTKKKGGMVMAERAGPTVAEGEIDSMLLLDVLAAVKKGDFSVRMPIYETGVTGKIYDTLNDIIDTNSKLSHEIISISDAVGKEGNISRRVTLGDSTGQWALKIDALNSLIKNLTQPMLDTARVVEAVAKGDLSQTIALESDGQKLEGVFLRTAKTVNTMVDQLGEFASEATRVAREVGTEGKLGGQARVEGVSGIWKDLTDNVNLMVSNLTNQLRNIAEVTVAVANGDLSKKITVDVRGEFLDLKNTVNKMVDQLNSFASETTRMAREVGTEGKLGGQARVEGVSGTWKELTDNVNQLAENLTTQVRSLAEVATAVIKGDLTGTVTVEARGEVEDLKNNMNEMIHNLRETTQKNAEQDWLKTNLARFTGMLQGQRDLAAVSQMLLSELAPVVNANHGIFYIMESPDGAPRLKMLSSYAFTERKHLATEFKIGEGLVGQCAYEKKRILLTRVPSDYVEISSGLGAATPLNIVVLPVVFENQVKAVVELASFDQFSPIHQSFLDQLADSLGVMLNTIEANMRTEDLLEQSQSLTEELQSQQNDLQQANEELEEKAQLLEDQKSEVEHKNREVEIARRAMEDKAEQLALTSRYKSEFLSNMSHELRTPLNSLLILAEQLGQNIEGNLTPKQVEFANTIRGSGTDLLTLINDILDLSKIESGTVTVEASDTLFADIRDYVERNFRHMAESKGLAFSAELGPNLPTSIYTDEKRLEQVIKNMLSNAFKFTEKGRVDLSIEIATSGWGVDHAILNAADKVIAFAVTDTGIGIPADKQKIVFEAFQQADGTTSRKYGGTGLGLAISREIAAMLGGELRLVRSEQGTGSTFVLYLPDRYKPRPGSTRPVPTSGGPGVTVAPPVRSPTVVPEIKPPAASAAEAAPTIEVPREIVPPVEPLIEKEVHVPSAIEIADDRENIRPGDRVILIIEDDRNFARILLDTTRERGFKGVVALTGQDGLAMAKRFVPDAITLDIHLPDIDGYVLLDRLMHDPQTGHVPVHVISATEERQRSLRLGAVTHIQKPMDKETLDEAFTRITGLAERGEGKLLLVEDDETQRMAIRELIGDSDVNITAVGTGEEALETLKGERFDCMVLDLSLPGMSGFEVIDRVNKELGLIDLPIIVYTGMDLTKEQERKLKKLTESVIVKDAKSPERLLAETSLFLHRVEASLPDPQRQMLREVRRRDPALAGKMVLIVDDDVRNIFALTSVLEQQNMKVLHAENGRDGIDMLKSNSDVGVVLMDIMMPEMDGYEAMRLIRGLPKHKSLPIIALTAKAMKGDREKCISAGASDYITKPVDTEQLLSLLRVWLYR